MSLGRFLRFVLPLAVALCVPSFLLAQTDSVPKVQIFGGYSWYHPGGSVSTTDVTTADISRVAAVPAVSSSDPSIPDFNAGWGAQVTYNFNNWLGATVDGSGHYNHGSIYTAAGGPKFTYRRGHFAPFGEVLAGVAFIGPNSAPSTNEFAFLAGGGLDYQVTRHFSIRPVQADYVLTQYNEFSAPGVRNYLSGVRLQAGLVLNFGYPKVVEVGANCTAVPSAVDAGGPVTITLTPSGFSPKRTLSYSYSSTGGKISGNTIDTTGLNAGTYTVSAKVADSGSGKNQRTAGCQVSFMVNPMNPPTLSVSASPSSVDAGQSSTITASGSSPDNRPLSYSCTSTAGNLSGAGTHYTLDTTGVQPASSITVNCTVTDDRSLTAAASAGVTINAAAAVVAPPPPPQTEIEEYLKIRSIYFATDKPSVKKPDGGLMPSQEATLAKLASSFKTYLQSKPDATLTLEGHADQRGSVAYNQALSERRVESTKHLLVEQGVPEASIQTKAYGKQHNLTEAEVKNAVEQNPEVSAEDRAKLLKKIKVIQWASNRRVDVTLNIPGKSPQESVQTYPFNAEDSMVLLSPAPPSKKAAATKKK